MKSVKKSKTAFSSLFFDNKLRFLTQRKGLRL